MNNLSFTLDFTNPLQVLLAFGAVAITYQSKRVSDLEKKLEATDAEKDELLQILYDTIMSLSIEDIGERESKRVEILASVKAIQKRKEPIKKEIN